MTRALCKMDDHLLNWWNDHVNRIFKKLNVNGAEVLSLQYPFYSFKNKPPEDDDVSIGTIRIHKIFYTIAYIYNIYVF